MTLQLRDDEHVHLEDSGRCSNCEHLDVLHTVDYSQDGYWCDLADCQCQGICTGFGSEWQVVFDHRPDGRRIPREANGRWWVKEIYVGRSHPTREAAEEAIDVELNREGSDGDTT